MLLIPKLPLEFPVPAGRRRPPPPLQPSLRRLPALPSWALSRHGAVAATSADRHPPPARTISSRGSSKAHLIQPGAASLLLFPPRRAGRRRKGRAFQDHRSVLQRADAAQSSLPPTPPPLFLFLKYQQSNQLLTGGRAIYSQLKHFTHQHICGRRTLLLSVTSLPDY